MEKIEISDGKIITMKELVRKFALEKNKDVKTVRIYKRKKDFYFILTIIPIDKIEKYIEDKLNEEEHRKQRKIDLKKKHKEFIEDTKKRLENGETISLIWFCDNIAYDIWGKDEKGMYKVQKKDTNGEFGDDNCYKRWSIKDIIDELENRDTPEEIIYQ